MLNQGAESRTRALRQTEWENFVPPIWRQDSEDEETQTVPLPQGNGASANVVDGNGSLLGCNCPAPPQFNPVCGSDGVTYGNLQKLNCARSCGRSRFNLLCMALPVLLSSFFLLLLYTQQHSIFLILIFSYPIINLSSHVLCFILLQHLALTISL